MAWWDFGIKGKNNENNLSNSGAIAYKSTSNLPDLINAIPIGSFVLHNSDPDGTKYRQLLTTTSGGTQIYLECLVNDIPNYQLHFPDETALIKEIGTRIIVKKGGTEWYVSEGYNTSNASRCVANTGSIYEYNYRNYAEGLFPNNGVNIVNPNSAFPKSKESGVNVNQVSMVKTSAGLDFFAIGYSCVFKDIITSQNIEFWCPPAYLGRISNSILENPFWFDPDADAIPQDEHNNIIDSGGGDPNRPVDYNYPGDNIDFPDLPSGASALGFGRMHIFHPTSAQLAGALDILWSDTSESTLESIIESCKKWWYKPEQYCVSLMLMPLNISGTNTRVYFGKYDTEVDAPAIGNQWQIVDCGSITVPLKSNSAFDFSPHVKAMIYLPYIGFRQINVNEIMGGTIYIKYYIDMYTGSGLCMIKIANQNSNTSVLYSYECNVAQQIPITSENYNKVINSLLSASSALEGSALMMGLGGPAGLMGGAMMAMGGVNQAMTQGVGNMGSPDIQVSGKLTPNTGALGATKPYVVLHFPVQSLPTGFANQNGFPSSVNIRLGNLSGYTEVEQIHLHIPGATKNELEYIERMLKSGVIL